MDAENYIQQVRDQCDSLINANIWPGPPDSDHNGWLDNFHGDDQVLAAIILQQLVLYSERTMRPLLRRAFKSLLQSVAGLERDRSRRDQLIDTFLANAIFCPVEDERPNITDSGAQVCRRLRKTLGIDQRQFVPTATAVEAARLGKPIVLVDDFVGSGEQVVHTWRRKYLDKAPASLAEVHAAKPFSAFLLVVAIAEKGQSRVGNLGVTPCFVHVLRNQHSLKSLEARTEFPIQVDVGVPSSP